MSIASGELLEQLFWNIDLPVVLVDDDRSIHYVSRRLAEIVLGEFGKISVDQEKLRIITEQVKGVWSEELKVLALQPGEHSILLPVRTAQEESPENVSTATICNVRKLIHNGWLVTVIPPGDQGSLFHQQRLNTLGLLAGGVAHDFNNILAGILGHITFLQAVLPAEGTHCESLQAITEGAKKASTLTGQILNFSRYQVSESLERVDLSGLVRSTSLLLRGALTATVDLSIDVPVEERSVHGIEGKLAQVLVNLVINARDALPKDEGKVSVVVRAANDTEHLRCEKTLGMNFPKETFTVLCVRDNGSGIRSEILERIFDPYFSTKGAKGTGLGLSTVAAIIEEHGGVVSVSSVTTHEAATSGRSQGTEFCIFLRQYLLNENEELSDETSSEPIELLRGEERILVVDDEATVRGIVAMSLRHLGYHVDEIGDPRKAMEMIETDRFNYDLVVCDMLMPHLSGEQIFNALRSGHSSVPFLVMSGYSEEGAIQRILTQPATDFIQKPFTVEDLSQSIRNALSGSGPSRKGAAVRIDTDEETE